MTKHYIYEIFGKKIGATQNVARRMMQQGVKEGEYRVIEEHTNAKTASCREIELQKEHGYPVDRQLYWKTLKNQNKVSRKKIASKIDWVTVKAKVDWNTALKTNRTPKIDYKQVRKKAKETTKDYNWNNIFVENRTPNIDYGSIAEQNSKKINQYDLNNNFIKTWNGITEAKKSMGNKEDRTINQCLSLKHPRKTAFGYIWKYTN
jgi:hypothetical protein